MKIFNRLVSLSKDIANAFLSNQKSEALSNTDLFNDEDKKRITQELTDPKRTEKRLALSNQIHTDQDWKNLRSKINVPVRIFKWKYLVAAIFIGVLTCGYFLRQRFSDKINSNPRINPYAVTEQIKTGYG